MLASVGLLRRLLQANLMRTRAKLDGVLSELSRGARAGSVGWLMVLCGWLTAAVRCPLHSIRWALCLQCLRPRLLC